MIEESDNESIEEIDKESEEECIEDLKEATGLNNKSTANWYDKNKFTKILTTIGSNNFNHKNKIGKFKFNDINNLINNIKNNTISEAGAKKNIKRLIDSQKTLLNLFDELLKAIFNNNNNKVVNEDKNKIVIENNNVNDNNNKSDDDYDSDHDYDSDNDDEQYYEIRQINKSFKKIDETKSFEDQTDILKKLPCLYDY